MAADSSSGASAVHGRVAWRCACFNVRRASRTVTRFYDRALAPSGLTAPQFTILGGVGMAGPIGVSALAERLGLDSTTLTRNLQILVRRRLIKMTPGDDRRERVISMTAAGEAALSAATPLWREAQDRVVAMLGADRLRRLIDDLAALDELDDNPS
jgi:DNA-binding MarR family transcriptional regulator